MKQWKKFTVTKDISKDKFVRLCEYITTKMGVRCTPDPVYGGGLSFECNKKSEYRCIRFNILKFPYFDKNVMEKWKGDNFIITNQDQELETFIITSSNLSFTVDELKIIQECFKENDLMTTN